MDEPGATWLTSRKAATPAVKKKRIAYLVACASGLVLKVLVASSAEVVTTVNFIREIVLRNKAHTRLVGAALILSRQCYARLGQIEVHKICRRLAKHGADWGSVHLRALRAALKTIEDKHGKKHAKKVQGRSGIHGGRAWITELLASPGWQNRWNEACEVVGSICCEADNEHSSNHCWLITARLAGVGKTYGSQQIMRLAHICRVWACNLAPVTIEAEDWPVFRDMMKDNVGEGLKAIDVHTLDGVLLYSHCYGYYLCPYLFDANSPNIIPQT
jgi:hypothetical protein